MENFVTLLIPVVSIIMMFVVVVAVTVTRGKTKQVEISSFDKRFFEEFATELREENAQLRSELHMMKETLHSIHKMMKEVE